MRMFAMHDRLESAKNSLTFRSPSIFIFLTCERRNATNKINSDYYEGKRDPHRAINEHLLAADGRIRTMTLSLELMLDTSSTGGKEQNPNIAERSFFEQMESNDGRWTLSNCCETFLSRERE